MIGIFKDRYDKLMPGIDSDERRYLLREFSARNAGLTNPVQWPEFMMWLICIPGTFYIAELSDSYSLVAVRVVVMALPAAVGLLAGYGVHRFTWPANRKKFEAYLKKVEQATNLPTCTHTGPKDEN